MCGSTIGREEEKNMKREGSRRMRGGRKSKRTRSEKPMEDQ